MKSSLFTAILLFASASSAHAGLSAEIYQANVSAKDRSDIQAAINDLDYYTHRRVAGGYRVRAGALKTISSLFTDLNRESKSNSIAKFAIENFAWDLTNSRSLIREIIRLHNTDKDGSNQEKIALKVEALKRIHNSLQE